MNPLAAIGYPLLAVATLNVCIGSFLLARRKDNPVARYAGALGFLNAIYCWVIGMAYVRASYGVPYDLYYRSAWVGWIGMAPMVQIVLTLKGDRAGAVRWGAVLYTVWASIWVLCLTTDLIEAGAVSLVPFIDRVGPFEQPARAAGAATLCWALFELYRVQRASAGRLRQQNAYLLLGLAVYAAAGLLLAGLVQLVGGIRFDPGLVSYFSMAWMAFTFYALTRHRLFDIRFVLSRMTVMLLLTAILVALQVVVYRSLSAVIGVLPGIVIASIVAGVALFATPMSRLLERRVEGLFGRRRSNYRRIMKESVRALASLGTVDDVLAKLLASLHETVESTSAALLLCEGDVFRVRQSYGTPDRPSELAATGALSRWLTEQPVPFVREEQQLGLAPERFRAIDADLRAFGGEVAVAMRYRSATLGMLIVGPKADRDAFLQADIDLLETLASEAALAVTNARLVEELQQAVRARDDFVSVAGHELRSPLMAIGLSVHTAMQLVPDDGPARGRLRAAERQIQRLTRLTDDLLNVARITAGRMTLEREPLDLGTEVSEVAARFSDEISRSGSQLELAVIGTVVGSWDRLRIEQIVTNLLANAVKYGGGTPITVIVERVADQARLTVRDRGIGIDAANRERIFDRFERATVPQHVGGFGLGLWITKQIVDAHGGTIRVESAPGAGSTFVVELPLA